MVEHLIKEITRNVFFGMCFSVLLVRLFIKFYNSYNRPKTSIPHAKGDFFDILGLLYYVPRGSAYLEHYNINTYALQTILAFEHLHLKESLFTFRLFNVPFVLVHKADAVEHIYHSTTVLDKGKIYEMLRPCFGTGLLTSSGCKWKSRRKLLTPSFHFTILKDFLFVMNKHTQNLTKVLNDLIDEEWIDISKLMTLCSLDIICETTLGVCIDAQLNGNSEYVKASFRSADYAVKRLLNPFYWVDFLYYKTKDGQQFQADINKINAFTTAVIQKKKCLLQRKSASENEKTCCKQRALLDLLLDHHMAHKDFTEGDIQEEVYTFTSAGHHTTSVSLSWSLYLIGLYPQVQKKIHAEVDQILLQNMPMITNSDLSEMKYLECVIKESLRLYPPALITSRKATEDIIVCGHTIPKEFEILVSIYGLHRDPDVFPNPELFDPDRFLPENTMLRHSYAYVPFSAGPRNCIGQKFAMMEMKVIIATVLKHFTIKSLDPRDKLLPTASITLHPSHPVRIKITPRRRSMK